MERTFVLIGVVLAFLSVALGAFGSHGLEGRVAPRDLDTFATAARYQMYHALALILTGWIVTRWPGAGAVVAGWSFLAGVVVFSGSLYLLVLTGARWLGAVAPLGGLCFLFGWAALAWRVLKG